MDAAFQLVAEPSVQEVAPFRFVHHRIRGPYVPWQRVATLDSVAETLERLAVDRTGPAFGVYYDLPFSERTEGDWTADLGYPVAADAAVPVEPGLRVRDFPATQAVGLRYRGDLASFPPALQFLLEWAGRRDVDVQGTLLERFHVSNALTGEEERDVWVSLRTVAR